MKKSYAAWAVLLVIALVASFLLGLTNEVTKDTIAQQQVAQAEASRRTLQPEADAFEELELEEESPLSSLYAAKKGEETVGHVATILTKGFGGEVEVTAGFDKDAVLTGISVGGANFSETPGLGAKSKDAAFTDQFKGKLAPLKLIKADGVKADNTVDAITSATITSTAVTNAVNTAAEEVKQALGIGGETGATIVGYRSATYSGQGYGGPVATKVTLDDEGRISEIVIGDAEFAETPGLGARALNADEVAPFIGLTPPLAVADVDALTGATVTKTAIVEAINKDAEKVSAVTDWDSVLASLPAVEETEAEEAPDAEPEEKPAPEPVEVPEGALSASAKGFAGDVKVYVTFTEDGKVDFLAVDPEGFLETEGFGARALNAEELAGFTGAQAPLAIADVDALTGATFTKTAIVNAVNEAYASTQPAAEPEAPETEEAPAAEAPAAEVEEKPAAEEAPAGETAAEEAAEAADGYTVTAKGLTGSFPVTVVLNEDGTVKSVTLGESDSEADKEYLAKANTGEFLGQFIGKTAPVEGIDAVAGATTSSTGIVTAVNEAFAQAQ